MRKKNLLFAALVIAGGCLPAQKFEFVQLNPQNPVATVKRIYFAPPVFDGGTINDKPAAEFRTQLKPEQLTSFDQDMVGFATFFSNYVQEKKKDGWLGEIEVAGAPGPDVYVANVRVESIQLGYWGGLNGETVAKYLVEVHGPDGALIESYRNTSITAYGFSSGERLRSMGSQIAMNLCRYIRARLHGATVDEG